MKLISFITILGTITYANTDCGCNTNRVKTDVKEKEVVCTDPTAGRPETLESMILIKGQNFSIGTDKAEIVSDGESPIRTVYLDDYFIDKYEVSNLEFKYFIETTGYKTEAEVFGDSFVFQLFLSKTTLKSITQSVKDAPWWVPVKGANWEHPEGKDSNINGNTLIKKLNTIATNLEINIFLFQIENYILLYMSAGMMLWHFALGLERGYHLKLNGKQLVGVILKTDFTLGEINFFQTINIGYLMLFAFYFKFIHCINNFLTQYFNATKY